MLVGSAEASAQQTSPQDAARQWAGRVLRVFPTLRGYRLRWLQRDLLAGVTFGAITIPGQLATAHLAGMPPATGLYGFLIACVVGAFISANRHLAFGVDSTVAPLLAAGVSALAATGTAEYVGLVTVTTLLVGLIILVIGLAELGWVGDLLPKEVVTGFLGGIAIVIVVNQLPGLFGLPSPEGSTSIHKLVEDIIRLPQQDVRTTVVGLAALAALLIVPRLAPRFPTALVVLAAATIASGALNLQGQGVKVLGLLPSGLPPFSLPSMDLDTLRKVLPIAVGIALISLAQTAATSRTVGAVGGFEVDVARDFRALGLGNVVSSAFGSFTVDASPPSSTILSEARARTQVAALTAALATGILIVAASGLIAGLPMSVLSAILIYIATKIFRVSEMRAMYHYSWRSFTLMLIAMLGVVLLGIELGLACAVLVAFIYRAKQVARPELLLLGRMPDGQWLPDIDDRSSVPEGVAAYRLNGPLWFGDANWFRQQMVEVTQDGPEKPRLLVMDATRMDDIDFTGVDALTSLRDLCDVRGISFAIACHVGRTKKALHRGGLDTTGENGCIFDSVEMAVQSWNHEGAYGLEQASEQEDGHGVV